MIVGPEKPLVEGLWIFLETKNIKVFGPRKKVAQLEGSKIFTKQICEKFNIPTAKFKICKSKEDAFLFLSSSNFPLVVKQMFLLQVKVFIFVKMLMRLKLLLMKYLMVNLGKLRSSIN